MNFNPWMNMSNMLNKPQMSEMVATPEQQQQQPTLALSGARPIPTSEAAPHKPAASMAGAPAQPQGLGRSPMAVNGHLHPRGSPMRSGALNVDPCVTVSRSPMNGKIPAGMPSTFHSRGKYQTGLPTGGPAPLSRSGSGMSQMTQLHGSADGIVSTSTTLSLGLGIHQSLPGRTEQMRKPATNLQFFPTIGNGVQGLLGPRLGTYQSEAAALATEARRRRRELKRTKSLQSQLQQEKKLTSAKSL